MSWLCIPLLVTLSYLAGCPLTARLPNKQPAVMFYQTLLAGLALLIVMLTILGTVFPVRSFALILTAGIVAVALGHRPTRQHGIRTLVQFVRTEEAHGTCLALLVALFLLNLLPVSVGENVAYEGADNYDTLHWVVTAEQLQTHDYFEDVHPEPGQEVLRIFNQFTGWYTWDGRVGGELVLSFLSVLLRIEPMFLFNMVASSLLVFWIAVIRLFLGEVSSNFARWIMPFLILGQPVIVYLIANGNHPNLWGVILFSYLVYLAREKSTFPGHVLWPLLVAIVTNAAFACYPEMLPFGFLTILVFAVAEVIPDRDWRRLGPWLMAALMIVIVNPVSFIRGMGCIHFKAVTEQDPNALPRLFTSMDWHERVVGLCSMSFPRVQQLSLAFGILASSVFLVLLVYPLLKRTHRLLWIAVAAGFVAMCAYSTFANFPYGYQKAASNFGLLISILAWLSIKDLLASAGSTWITKGLRRLVPLGAICLFVFFFQVNLIGMFNAGSNRNIALERDDLNVIQSMVGNEMLVIDDRSFEERKFNEIWLPYVFRNQATYYSSSTASSFFPDDPPSFDRYPRWFGRVIPPTLFDTAKYVLTASDGTPRLVRFKQDPLFSGSKFALYPFAGIVELDGIYKWEGANSWASDHVKIIPRAAFGTMRVEFGHTVPQLPNGSLLQVTNHFTGESEILPIKPGMELEFTVGGKAEGFIELVSLSGAIQPSAVSDSIDTRKLAYQIRSIEMDPIYFLDGISKADGLHAWEGNHAWMSAEATLYPGQTNTGQWLNVKVMDKFQGVAEGILLVNGLPAMTGTHGSFSLNIPNDGSPVRLVSSGGAQSPKDALVDSHDPRPLSYSIGHLSVTEEPLFVPLPTPSQ